MKNTVLIAFVIIIGLILATGCVGQIKHETNETLNKTVTPTNTFVPISNASNVSNITVTSGLKGPLRVTIGSWDADLPVTIDNTSVGIVTHNKPLDLMIEEGNHTVRVCAGTICLDEDVTIQFARQRLVDFESRLLNEVVFPQPTARIVSYYPSGDEFTVTVEFINPSEKDLTMSAQVQLSYTYIESRSNNRVGSGAQRIVTANVKSGARIMQTVDLNLASGYSYVYSIPTISGITSR